MPRISSGGLCERRIHLHLFFLSGSSILFYVFTELQMIDSLHYGMAKIADLMIKNVASPIVCDRSKTLHTEELSSDSGENNVAILKLLSSTEFLVS